MNHWQVLVRVNAYIENCIQEYCHPNNIITKSFASITSAAKRGLQIRVSVSLAKELSFRADKQKGRPSQDYLMNTIGDPSFDNVCQTLLLLGEIFLSYWTQLMWLCETGRVTLSPTSFHPFHSNTKSNVDSAFHHTRAGPSSDWPRIRANIWLAEDHDLFEQFYPEGCLQAYPPSLHFFSYLLQLILSEIKRQQKPNVPLVCYKIDFLYEHTLNIPDIFCLQQTSLFQVCCVHGIFTWGHICRPCCDNSSNHDTRATTDVGPAGVFTEHGLSHQGLFLLNTYQLWHNGPFTFLDFT